MARSTTPPTESVAPVAPVTPDAEAAPVAPVPTSFTLESASANLVIFIAGQYAARFEAGRFVTTDPDLAAQLADLPGVRVVAE